MKLSNTAAHARTYGPAAPWPDGSKQQASGAYWMAWAWRQCSESSYSIQKGGIPECLIKRF
jgi:hypothetical protein